MRTIKCPLVLTDNEYSLIINSLNNLRNDLIAQGRYTDAVDEKINQILSITPHLRKSNKEIVGYKPKEKPSEQFYEEIKNIRNIGNNINQIARIANAKGVIDVPHLK